MTFACHFHVLDDGLKNGKKIFFVYCFEISEKGCQRSLHFYSSYLAFSQMFCHLTNLKHTVNYDNDCFDLKCNHFESEILSIRIVSQKIIIFVTCRCRGNPSITVRQQTYNKVSMGLGHSLSIFLDKW